MSDYEAVESSARQWHDELQHQEKMNMIVEAAEYNLFSMIKPKLYQDGNQWCCLYGENIQTGIVGFGETPHKAVMQFNCAWHEKIKDKRQN
ncbi:MAG TPA: hypothetical protein VFM69_15855 [Pricia sp.]|nr:hypothetical protein [Pricia sp.]